MSEMHWECRVEYLLCSIYATGKAVRRLIRQEGERARVKMEMLRLESFESEAVIALALQRDRSQVAIRSEVVVAACENVCDLLANLGGREKCNPFEKSGGSLPTRRCKARSKSINSETELRTQTLGRRSE